MEVPSSAASPHLWPVPFYMTSTYRGHTRPVPIAQRLTYLKDHRAQATAAKYRTCPRTAGAVGQVVAEDDSVQRLGTGPNFSGLAED